MPRKPRNVDEFPFDSFGHDVKRLPKEAISGGFADRKDQIVFRCVFPGFDLQGPILSYRADIALLLTRSTVSNDIVEAMKPSLTLKGIGPFEHAGVRQHGFGMADAAASATQIGTAVAEEVVGNIDIIGVFASLFKRFRGVQAESTKGFKMIQDGQHLGTVSTRTRLLAGGTSLRKTICLPTGQDYERREVNQVVLTQLTAKFTRQQVEYIMENAEWVDPVRYGGPRLVTRLNYPEELFDNVGNFPATTFLLGTGYGGNRDHYYQPLEMEPVTYDWDARSGADLAAEIEALEARLAEQEKLEERVAKQSRQIRALQQRGLRRSRVEAAEVETGARAHRIERGKQHRRKTR